MVSWGNDFRPDYRRLGPIVDELGHPPVLALTATAAPPVRVDIIDQLRMRDPAVLVAGFDRPNLHLAVRTFLAEDDKLDAVVDTAVELEGPGIVYVGKRRETEELAAGMAGRNIRAGAYHAGLRAAERSAVQDAFLGGDLDVLVATTAFGMGIDKADVRFVLHATVAESLDAYYQEIGRAGRDGEPASVVLFYRPEDLGLRRFFAAGGFDEQRVREVYEFAAARPGDFRAPEIGARMDVGRRRVTSAVNLLEQVGAVALDRRGRVGALDWSDSDDVVRAARDVAERREAFDATRLEMMRGYAEATTCRRQLVLSYFGDDPIEPCGNCDNCDAGLSTTTEETNATSPFAVGERVAHREFGVGTVIRFEHPERVVVLFDEQGYRTLSLSLVIDHDLLSQAS
ncbi:helicase-related protein [Nakamurella sp. GG22]